MCVCVCVCVCVCRGYFRTLNSLVSKQKTHLETYQPNLYKAVKAHKQQTSRPVFFWLKVSIGQFLWEGLGRAIPGDKVPFKMQKFLAPSSV